MPAADVLSSLKQTFPQIADRASLDHPAFDVSPGEVVVLLTHLRDTGRFDLLTDLTAIDNGEEASPRFTVVFHLFSTVEHAYVRVAAACASNDEPSMPSVTSLWPGANWHEREVFDMFGIRFAGHPDLRRILMWDGYPYHPLRKEFPLAGIETNLPDLEVVAETGTKVIAAPMAGGPFVASTGEINLTEDRAPGEGRKLEREERKARGGSVMKESGVRSQDSGDGAEAAGTIGRPSAWAVEGIESEPRAAMTKESGDRNRRTPARVFEDLIVWQKAHAWVLGAYKFSEGFPKHELYSLTSQFRRAAVSIPANIAEGFKKMGVADKRKFMNTAQGSLEECRYYLILVRDLGYGDSRHLVTPLEEVSRLLDAYARAIETPGR